jgi:hypothetical protein
MTESLAESALQRGLAWDFLMVPQYALASVLQMAMALAPSSVLQMAAGSVLVRALP